MKYPKLRIAWSVGCGILCLLLIVLWVRSYWWADRLHGRIIGDRMFVVASKEGRTVLVGFQHHTPSNWPWEVTSYPCDDARAFPVGPERWYRPVLGFCWMRQPFFVAEEAVPLDATGQRRGLLLGPGALASLNGSGPMVPSWSTVLFCAAAAAAPWVRWSKRFSLRTLLIAATVVAGALGLIIALLR